MPEPLPIPLEPNPYKVLDRRMIYDSPWIRVREDRFIHRRGAEGCYAVCGFRRTACGVLALDEQDRVVLVGQWRYPLEHYSWELPEGGGDERESPFEAVRRELQEEAGLDALVWEPLAFFHTSNSSTDEEVFLFRASDLMDHPDGHAPEEDEELALRREPFEQCLSRVLSGEITDSLTVMALLAEHARRTGVPGHLAPGLAERFFQCPMEHPSPGRTRWQEVGR
ncbi:NUDIX domain-containing protein [Holophaga foetida]|uniref:NUDIX domain-containing protein n=1 Tax=Holophaga foetida TaxID=35839 RepID=UPI0002472F57|nr:NUDIX hydrolase [Holophaga foetida]